MGGADRKRPGRRKTEDPGSQGGGLCQLGQGSWTVPEKGVAPAVRCSQLCTLSPRLPSQLAGRECRGEGRLMVHVTRISPLWPA